MPNLVLAILCAIASTYAGYGNIFITVYGLRTDFLQIPLIFLIPQIINRDDVIDMGRFFLWTILPVALLVVIQFRSPQGSFINKGALNTWYGTVRPSGPFSFIAGLVSFFAQGASFLLFGAIQKGTYKNSLLIMVTPALLLATFVSGSRSCIVSTGIVVAVAVLCVVMRGKGGQSMLIACGVLVVLAPLLSALPVFQDGAIQLAARFHDAAQNGEDTSGFVARFLGTMTGPIENMGKTPIAGYGLGMGTNVAANLLTGKRGFIGAEDEWGRLIFESGPLLGSLLIIFRVALTLTVAQAAFKAFRNDNILPIMIYSACGLLVLNGQWGVPATLGFAIFGTGLTLAACEEPEEEYDDEDEEHDDDEEGEEHDEDEHEEDEHHDDDEESDHSPATDKMS